MPTKKKIRKKTGLPKGSGVRIDKAKPAAIKIAMEAKKQRTPTLSIAVRRLVILEQQLTFAEISVRLVEDGWNREEIERRKSTIVTLRADTLAILAIAREEGWRTPVKRK